MSKRPGLTQERIVDAAIRVADRGGLAQVSMRNVGRELDVEAMSLYHHIAGKEPLLDAMVEWIFARIRRPEPDAPWRAEMTARAASARSVLAGHPWALGLIESRRTPGPGTLLHHESVLACLRRNGFSVALAAHAFSALDAYVYGFVLTEVNLPFEAGESAEAFTDSIRSIMPAGQYPNLAEMIRVQVVGRPYDYGDEFGFGLDLVLDSLERHLASPPDAAPVKARC